MVDYLWVLLLVKSRQINRIKEGSKPFAFHSLNFFLEEMVNYFNSYISKSEKVCLHLVLYNACPDGLLSLVKVCKFYYIL